MNNDETQGSLENANSEGNEQNQPDELAADIFNDGLFTIKISDEMTLRNALRAGLVEAQGKDTDKIPMFVSWPPWLEDGVVCLFSKYLHAVLRKVMRDTADVARQDLGVDVKTADLGTTPEPAPPLPVPEDVPEVEGMIPEGASPYEEADVEIQPVQGEEEPASPYTEEPPEDPLHDDQVLADKLFDQIRNELKE